MQGSGPEESASPQFGSHKQGDGEAEVGRARCRGTTRVVLAVHDWVVTAISTTARDVDMSQAEGFSHVEAFAPRGSCTAFDCVVWVPQPMGACGFQTLIHGASAGD